MFNQRLYTALRRMPGGVMVSKKGQKGKFTTCQSPDGYTAVRPVSSQGGEEYRINCPMCGDTRQRCHVNYMFGATIRGLPVVGAVHCFNENCEGSGLTVKLKELLVEYTYAYTGEDQAEMSTGQDETPEALITMMAGKYAHLRAVQTLESLPDTHPAIRYVKERGLDAKYLTQNYDVGHYEGVVSHNSRRRIIIPVQCMGRVVGHQARAIPGWTPLDLKNPDKKWPWKQGKYINSTGMITSALLYNYDNAKNYDVVVVTEGVVDVWKIGPWAVSIFTDTLSDTQLALLSMLKTRSGKQPWFVMLGEPESVNKWNNNLFKLRERVTDPGKIKLRIFNSGDPGSRTPAENADIVKEALNGPVTGTI